MSGAEWKPDSELAEAVDAIIKFEGVPNEPAKPEEKTKWQKFCAWFVPKAREKGVKAAELLEERGELEVAEKREQVNQIAAETAEIAARTDQRRAATTKVVGEEIRKIFSDPTMPQEAQMLQVANLLESHPHIADQLEKVIAIYARLQAVHGVRVEVVEPEEQKRLPQASEESRAVLQAEPGSVEIQGTDANLYVAKRVVAMPEPVIVEDLAAMLSVPIAEIQEFLRRDDGRVPAPHAELTFELARSIASNYKVSLERR